jgi:beta-lactam-binding protein with PASTA domain
MKRYFRIALTVLSMLLVMLLSAAITLRVALHGHEVTVPDFAGMTLAEAGEAALKTGVGLNIENRFYSTTVPAGRVLSQAPAAGSSVRQGWQVRVTESIGPQQVTIPNVVGQTVREASLNIRRGQLDLGILAHIDAPGDPGMVLAQTPPPNAGVDQPRVNLLLSSAGGGAASAYVMPSLLGMTAGAAWRAASALGLRVALVGDTPPAPAAPAPPPPAAGAANALSAAPSAAAAVPAVSGPVVAQSPDAGYRVLRGDTVRLTVGHAQPAAVPPAPSR